MSEKKPEAEADIKYELWILFRAIVLKTAFCVSNIYSNLNFIYTIWDNCHRDQPEFPEVRRNNQFEKRELYLNNLRSPQAGY